MIRLDKYIASVTDLSRKQVRSEIRTRQVCVDGEVQTDHSLHVGEHSEVSLAGTLLKEPGYRYLMLHKPQGVICATRDSHQTTVIDLLDIPRRDKLQIAGRLDIDTTGLVLLTDDGQWNHRLTSPRHQCIKLYQVTTALEIAPDTVAQFDKGILLQPENKLTRPAQLLIRDCHHAQLGISEGKYHQVKRMFGAVGNAVVALHRSAVGAISLDDTLLPGQYRSLLQSEIAAIQL
jgi:16S rRNA pseudouridine516 synthase